MEHGLQGTSEEGERLVDVLVHGSLNASTKKEYGSKWATWTTERAKANLGPWLHEADGVDSAVRELTVFMPSRCMSYKNQSQTVKGYLAAIKYFHKLYAGWELPTSHFRVGKGWRRRRKLRIECPREELERRDVEDEEHRVSGRAMGYDLGRNVGLARYGEFERKSMSRITGWIFLVLDISVFRVFGFSWLF